METNISTQQSFGGLASKIKHIDGNLQSVRGILKNTNRVPGEEVQGPDLKDAMHRDSLNENLNPPVETYATKLQNEPGKAKVNFRTLVSAETKDGVDVVLTKESVRNVQTRYSNTLYGYFLGNRLPFPVVEYFAKHKWANMGMQKIMMNAAGFYFFKFESAKGMKDVLEGGPWLIRNNPLLLNVWSTSTLLKKEEVKTIPVWVKIHNVPLVAYTDDGLSMIATKLGEPKLLDAYIADMCSDAWGRSSYARALIEISADKELKEEVSLAIPNMEGEGYVQTKMAVEYEFNPPRCESCCIFGHVVMKCPKTVQVTSNGGKIDKDGFQDVKGKKKVIKPAIGKKKTTFLYRPVIKPIASTLGVPKGVGDREMDQGVQ